MAEEKTKEEQDLQNRLYQSIGFEVAANTAVDFATGWLMPAAPVYAGVNFVAGGAINTLAQLWRQDDNFSWGEVGASSAIGVVPGLGGKGVTGIARATAKGAGLGVAHEAIRVGVDEQRILTPEEVAGGALIGGAFGGGTKVVGDSVGALAKHRTDKIATRRAKGSYTRPGTYVDRTDIWKPDDLTGPQKTYERFQQRRAYGPEYGTEDPYWFSDKGTLRAKPLSAEDIIRQNEIENKVRAAQGQPPVSDDDALAMHGLRMKLSKHIDGIDDNIETRQIKEFGITKTIEVPILQGENLTGTRRTLRRIAEQYNYADDVAESTARRTFKAPAELGAIYLDNAEAHYRRFGNFDRFPHLKLPDGTILRADVKDKLTGRASFKAPFDKQMENLKTQKERYRKAVTLAPDINQRQFFETKLKQVTELREELGKIGRLHGHHIAPLDLSYRFIDGLDEDDIAWVTGEWAKKGVFAGNRRLNADWIPTKIHDAVHAYIKKRIKEANFDIGEIRKMSLEDRKPYLDKFADIVLDSQEESLRLIRELGGNKPIPKVEARRLKKLVGPDNYSKLEEDIRDMPENVKQQMRYSLREWNRQDGVPYE